MVGKPTADSRLGSGLQWLPAVRGVAYIRLLGRFTVMKILTPLLLAVLLCGCSGPRHVSSSHFEQQYAWVGQPQTMQTVTYLGQRDGRAFIRTRSMSSLRQKTWSDHVIYVDLAELEPAFRDSLPKTEMKDTRCSSDPVQRPAPASADVGPYIFVSREVAAPGRYDWTNGMRLADAIQAAKGFTVFAGRSKIRIRHVDGRVDKYDYDRQNPALRAGDFIHVIGSLD